MAYSTVIAGGSGFLGLSLARRLAASGQSVAILSRNTPRESGPWTHVAWDGRTLDKWASVIDGAEAIVNLAGRSVDCIKTPDHCDEILRSRVEATRVLGLAIARASQPPRVWVQMSTAHAYGDPPSLVCDEHSPFGYGLAPTVARAWEGEFDNACPIDNRWGIRRVVLRTSFVLGRAGGALPRLEKLARLGLGGTVGTGEQGMSWLHNDDMNAIFELAITDAGMSGAFIASSPRPVSNAEFMRELRRAVHAPIGLPARAWMVRIGAPLIMRTDPELALYGRYVVSRRLEELGFTFKFPTLREAMRHLYANDDSF